MWVPVFIIGGERFIFAYQDQVFTDKAQAEMRGTELGDFFKDKERPIEYKETIDIIDLGKRPVVPIMGFKICFIDREVRQKKNARGKRKPSGLQDSRNKEQ